MRLVSLMLAAMMATSAMAQTVPPWLIPSPWSIGITVAQWLSKDSRKIFYVEVTAEGADLEQARQSAFRMAVERAVGTVVVSETEVRNLRIHRDEIITYASGYVDNYELVQTQTVDNRTQVQMKVWVSQAKLANRLLNESRAAGDIEGGRIAQQIESLQYERATGDRLLLTVLRDFPRRAFDVQVLPTRVTMDANRSPILHIFLDLSWNQRYLDSLATAIKSINQKQGCDRWFKPLHCDSVAVRIQAGGASAWMDDENAWHLFHREMVISRPQVQITVLDPGGRWLFRQCVGVNELDHEQYSPYHYVEIDAGRVLVREGMKKRLEIPIPVGTYPVSPRDMDRVEARVVRNSDCQS